MKSALKNLSTAFLLVLLLCGGRLSAQDWENNTWLGVSYETELADDLTFDINQQVRLSNLLRRYENTLTNFGFSYKVNKYFKFGTGYRITFQPGVIGHRIGAFVTPRYKTKDFNFNFRIAYQAETEFNEPFTHDLRQKFSVKYTDFKDWRPYAYAEFFYHLQNNFRGYNAYRAGLGTEIDVKKGHDLNVALFYQKGFNREAPRNALTLKVGYLFNP